MGVADVAVCIKFAFSTAYIDPTGKYTADYLLKLNSNPYWNFGVSNNFLP